MPHRGEELDGPPPLRLGQPGLAQERVQVPGQGLDQLSGARVGRIRERRHHALDQVGLTRLLLGRGFAVRTHAATMSM